jgi:monoamine oxidase
MSRFVHVLNRRFGRLRGVAIEDVRATRRAFVRAGLACAGGLLLSACGSFARGGRAGNGRRVVIVGAGFAGLACAYELRSVGYDVIVIDARRRVGGRVLSFRDFVPGRTVEGGGELIGSNHPHWQAYAKRFRLRMLDLSDEAVPIVLGGRVIDGAEGERLWEGVDDACRGLNALAVKIDAERPWESPGASDLDHRTLGDWIRENVADPQVRAVLDANLGGDNGVPTERMSLLAMLAQVKGGGVERFWDETEVYRCAGGNQQLAEALARSLGSDRLRLGVPVSEVRAEGPVCAAVLANGEVVEGDSIVLAVPPTTWARMRVRPWFDHAPAIQLGSNVKYLTHVSRRFWRDSGRSPYTLSDGDVNWTWESTDGQDGRGEFGLTAFCGGAGSERVRSRDPVARDAAMGETFEAWFPGFRAHLRGRRFMDWPGDAWTLGAYSAYAPGQITSAGPRLHEGLGRLHFAGEHCSFAFMGYMEGALHAGAACAWRIAAGDGVRTPRRVAVPVG